MSRCTYTSIIHLLEKKKKRNYFLARLLSESRVQSFPSVTLVNLVLDTRSKATLDRVHRGSRRNLPKKVSSALTFDDATARLRESLRMTGTDNLPPFSQPRVRANTRANIRCITMHRHQCDVFSFLVLSTKKRRRERERERGGEGCSHPHEILYSCLLNARIREVNRAASSGVTSSLTFTGFPNTSSPTPGTIQTLDCLADIN